MEPNSETPDELLTQLITLRGELLAYAAAHAGRLALVHPNFQDSAENLLHYLALRRQDQRPLQMGLAKLGLSSLGRAESHVLATVDAIISVLARLFGRTETVQDFAPSRVDFARGEQLLIEHTQALLGAARAERAVRIMVTMPTEAATNYALVRTLLAQGMDCMRINCAHDDAADWLKMIQHLRRAEGEEGRRCRVVMDLAGPKLRTGPLEPGPEVLSLHPRRDALGRVVEPARVWLFPAGQKTDAPGPVDANLPVAGAWLRGLRPGEVVRLRDARDARRKFTIVEVTPDGCLAEATKTTYVVSGTRLRRARSAACGKARRCKVGALPPLENALLLQDGDLLKVTRDLELGKLAVRAASGEVVTPPSIGCTLPDVFEDVRPGDPIWFDDGKIGSTVEGVTAQHVQVRITRAGPSGRKLRADKGINLPDTPLCLPALTQQDQIAVEFVAQHADVVELSFANSAEDVAALQEKLASLGESRPAIVLKIETRRGFENLPDMLLTAMASPCVGIMIARGDLAVECGFERLAEVQEEMLWICEAAHVPVIWATQVLETLAKTGIPSRAEITDAAMGHRAECVMLNKGPHIVSAVQLLDGILRRMQEHQAKKRSMLRELNLAHSLTR